MFLTGSHPEKLQVEGPALMAVIDKSLKEAGLRDRVCLCGIGGITPQNCQQVLEAGADGVAVISGIEQYLQKK
jgi:thiamine monophosphate synthase